MWTTPSKSSRRALCALALTVAAALVAACDDAPGEVNTDTSADLGADMSDGSPGDDDIGSDPCAGVDCGAHGQCRLDLEGAGACLCDAGYAGASCASCAPGFAPAGAGCAPVTIDCAVDAGVCGAGTCVSGAEGDTCQCPVERAGRVCEQCAPGFQDHDADGTCAASCAQQPCTAPQFCDDSSGEVTCRCPAGRTGSNCDQCESGYTPVETDSGLTCRATCAVLSCGIGQCSDLGVEAVCLCPLGHAGDTCQQCSAPDAAPDGQGRCVSPRPDSQALLALRVDGTGGTVLGALDLADGALSPLVWGASQLTTATRGLDVDPELGVFYAIVGNDVLSVDLSGGLTRTVATVTLENAPALLGPSYDAVADVLYVAAVGWDQAEILSVDIATGAVTSLGVVPERGARAMAFDAAGRRLLVLTGGKLVAFDVDTAAPSTLFELTLRSADAFETWPSARVGDQLVVAAPSRALDAWAGARCTAALRALGRDPSGYAAPFIVARPRQLASSEPPEASVLASPDEADGAPLLVFAATDDAKSFEPVVTPVPVEVHSDHPAAVACVVSSGVPVALTIPAEARLAHLVVVLDEAPGSTLTVAPGFVPEPGHDPVVVVDPSGELTLELPAGVTAVHTERAALGFDAARPEHSTAADTLLILDLATGTLTQRLLAPLGTLGGLAWLP